MQISFEEARTAMIDGQIRPNRVAAGPITEAFKIIPKELFTPKAYGNLAYMDETIVLDCGECLLKPFIHARMLQEAGLTGSEFVLDIGCGTGYSSAILSKLCGTVIGLTHDALCMKTAGTLLSTMNIDNAIIVQGPLAEGYGKQGPYDFIFIDGLVEEIPQTLFDQMAPKGKLMAIVRNTQGIGTCTLFTKFSKTLSSRMLFEVEAPLLQGFEKKQTFQF